MAVFFYIKLLKKIIFVFKRTQRGNIELT